MDGSDSLATPDALHAGFAVWARLPGVAEPDGNERDFAILGWGSRDMSRRQAEASGGTVGPSLRRSAFDIRAATRGDIAAIHGMIGALAHYERLAHLFVASQSDIAEALFGPAPAAEVLIARKGGKSAGFALFFHNFSTFLGRRGIWLEDLFVLPAHRRQGCAQALLRAVATLAVERNCGRFEWSVLDWNAAAIDFYQGLGATVLPDWRIVRVVGPALSDLAAGRGARLPEG